MCHFWTWSLIDHVVSILESAHIYSYDYQKSKGGVFIVTLAVNTIHSSWWHFVDGELHALVIHRWIQRDEKVSET